MQFKLQTENINLYLQNIYPVCLSSKLVAKIMGRFNSNNVCKAERARLIYEHVRDVYPHTFDIGANEVSITAEDVIRNGHGICYAKSHLLAALMRSAGIPTGFCYELIILDDETKPYLVIHAFNAVYIDEGDLKGKWIRLDARGNKAGVDAQFSLDEEKLAFPVRPQFGEKIFDTIYYEPNKKVIEALQNSTTSTQLMENLPRDL